MCKCCPTTHFPRRQRRLHGFQLPLNPIQILGWVAIIANGFYTTTLIQFQFDGLKRILWILFPSLYTIHIVVHVTTAMTDPSEEELRKLKVVNVPEFDRSIHSHVIENGRCHLCNIYTSSKFTKHCSTCNKCINNFDHHCPWLNNCIGQRNYIGFLACVVTAMMIAALTLFLSVRNIVLFYTNRSQLSVEIQRYINCTIPIETVDDIYCKSSLIFLTFTVMFCFLAVVIGVPMLQLCCFHIYIGIYGITTYEYIMRSMDTKVNTSKRYFEHCCPCCNFKLSKKMNVLERHRVQSTRERLRLESTVIASDKPNQNRLDIEMNNGNVHKVKNILYDSNKVFPHDSNI